MKKQIGWCNPTTMRICYTEEKDAKPEYLKSYTVPVFIEGEIMNDQRQAVELLEKAKLPHWINQRVEIIDQAIAILKQPECKFCNDTKEVPKPMPKEPHPCNDVNLLRTERTITCPDCQKPSVSEFIKYCREKYTEICQEDSVCGKDFDEALTHLDKAEAENKQLETHLTKTKEAFIANNTETYNEGFAQGRSYQAICEIRGREKFEFERIKELEVSIKDLNSCLKEQAEALRKAEAQVDEYMRMKE